MSGHLKKITTQEKMQKLAVYILKSEKEKFLAAK